jgi:hypothetical protein
MLLDLFTGNVLARRLSDAALVWYGHRRTRMLDRMDVPEVQRKTLLGLLNKASRTRFGRDHGFGRITTVEQYQAAVPIRTYEDFWRDYWQAVFPRLEGSTWPDFIPYFALSSGTTSGTTKYIPISKEMLVSNRKAAYTTVALFRHFAPEARLFNGRFFFLGGNTDLRKESNGSLSGDLSAIAAIEVPAIIRPYSFPPHELAGIADWDSKVFRLAEASAKLPITAISGVPAWILVLFDRLKRVTGKSRVADVWPTLRLVIHGGTKFDPYREVFRQELGPDVHTCEVYPASEGFIATEDPRHGLLRVVPDHGLFFEFMPIDQFADGKLVAERPARHTLANVEVGVQYAVAVTTCAGLWSYLVGDTVTFERRDPPLIRFTGRTKYFLSAFGEHLISEELEKAVAVAAHETASSVAEFHVGPVFPTDPKQPGHHLYLVEFRTPPANLSQFVDILDATLSRTNEDYEAHRKTDLSMLKPVIRVVKPGGFERWMLAHGKRPPQHKVPRMDNSGEQTKAIMTWMSDQSELIS